jgi:hypothetical protein
LSLLGNILQSNGLNEKDLAAGYLAAFYNGKTTQKSLTDYLQLANIHLPIRMPTTFDGLRKLIYGDVESKLAYEKTWFCGICLKITKKLNNRFQRACEQCQTK